VIISELSVEEDFKIKEKYHLDIEEEDFVIREEFFGDDGSTGNKPKSSVKSGVVPDEF